MCLLKNYKPTKRDTWKGRIDDSEDPNSYRWHQVIELVDINREDLEPLISDFKGFCFLGFCCDEGVKRNIGRIGTSKAPESIRHELSNLPCTFKKNVKLYDAGDIYCVNSNLETAQKELTTAVKKILSLNYLPIVLGGGHEISLGHFNGILNSIVDYKISTKLGIINFDAHFDLRPYKNGGNSGTMFLQIADQCRDLSIDFLYFCIGIQRYGNTVSIFKTADNLGVKYIFAKDIDDSNLSKIYNKIDNYINTIDYIYLTICADVFSSAFAPGVSAPQPFGLNPEIVLKLIKHVINSKKVVSVDIAEVSPRFDEDNRTAKLIAIVIFAIINTFLDINFSK